MPWLGRITAGGSQFANKHGVYLGRRSAKIHTALYRRTRGRVGGRLPSWPEARILLLDHTGARSGAKRTSPLIYHADGDATTIQIGSVTREVRARVAADEERDRLWREFVAFYPGYEFFQRHAKGRKIPIVILDPR